MPYKDPEKARESNRRYNQLYYQRIKTKRSEARKRRRAMTAAQRRADINSEQKRTYYAAREKLFDILGRICVGCGHVDKRVMEFDHIHDDGAKDRRRFQGARSFLDYYGRHPEEGKLKLQILCRNCNWLKRKGYNWGGPRPESGGKLLDGKEWNEYPRARV